MHFTRLNESDEYRQQREELRIAEMDLVDHVERVAALRRALPTGTLVDDYELIDVWNNRPVRLSYNRNLWMHHLTGGAAYLPL